MYLEASNVFVWVERDERKVLVTPYEVDPPLRCSDGSTQNWWGNPNQHGIAGRWHNLICAGHPIWGEMDDSQRVTLMLETAIDLAMDGFDLSTVLREFAKVRQFRALGDEGYPNPMREALIKAKVMDSGKPNEDEVAAAMAAYRQATVIAALEPTEQKARAMAKRAGLKAFKSRKYGDPNNHGKFQILDPALNWVLAGEKFDLTTGDVVEFCRNYERQRVSASN